MSANKISIDDDKLTVEPLGLDKLWSLKSRLEIPVSHIKGATYDPGITQDIKGLRSPGLATHGKYAGTFIKDGDRSFWNVDGVDKTIVIQLHDESYERLVLTADDPRGTVDTINTTVQQHDNQ